MRLLLLALLIALSTPVPAYASQVDQTRAELAVLTGKRPQSRLDAGVFHTPALDREMPFFVYLPPGYDLDPGARFPVLYMLHGMGGSSWEWAELGLFGAADELVASGAIDPFLIVLPQGDQAYWFDHANGDDYGAYVARDVVAEIDQRYRTIPAREARAVGGLSMGSMGALQLAINYPNVFGAVGAHGLTLRDYPSMAEHLGEELSPRWLGDERRYAAFDPISLYRQLPAVARRLDIWLDVGADDAHWRPIAAEFHQQLLEDHVPHEWRILPGGHDPGRYQRAHAKEYLRFYGKALALATSSSPRPSFLTF
jgi:enterochelin esterase-like enzyme